ncbi:hypothetical protein D3C87_1472210 [compost metagenome]
MHLQRSCSCSRPGRRCSVLAFCRAAIRPVCSTRRLATAATRPEIETRVSRAARATRVGPEHRAPEAGAGLRARARRALSAARHLRSGIACWTRCGTLAKTRLRRSGSAVPSMGRWTQPRRCATGGRGRARPVRQGLAASLAPRRSSRRRTAAGASACWICCSGWPVCCWPGCCGADVIDGVCAQRWRVRGACRGGFPLSPCNCLPAP